MIEKSIKNTTLPAQVDQNGIVHDPKADRKCLKNEHLRQYTAYKRPVFDPYHTVLSGAEIRAVSYPYRKRTVFDRFLQLYGYNTVRRLIT
jgi:hypothetical protein